MNNYKDKYGRFHHKECINGEPSGGNGWIYTAYAKKAGIAVDMGKLKEGFELCKVTDMSLEQFHRIDRSPGKIAPYISRDEILGLAELKLLEPHNLHNWSFSPLTIPEFSLTKLISQLWELSPSVLKDKWAYVGFPEFELKFKHRNYFWQNKLDQLYRFAFSVPVQDRHFILKSWDKFQWYNPVHVFYASVAKVDSMLPKKSGIKWLKYGAEENKKAMVEEFPVDHPIRLKLGL